jgi:hypothetical protein
MVGSRAEEFILWTIRVSIPLASIVNLITKLKLSCLSGLVWWKCLLIMQTTSTYRKTIKLLSTYLPCVDRAFAIGLDLI